MASIQAYNYICKLWPDATVASAAKIIEFASQRKCKPHSIDAHNKDYMDLIPRDERVTERDREREDREVR